MGEGKFGQTIMDIYMIKAYYEQRNEDAWAGTIMSTSRYILATRAPFSPHGTELNLVRLIGCRT